MRPLELRDRLREADAFEAIRSPLDCKIWRFEKKFPMSEFINKRLYSQNRSETSKRKWTNWLTREAEDRPGYYDELAKGWLSDPLRIGPIIIARLPNGLLDIGDGWHRIAISVVAGIPSVPAIVLENCESTARE